MAEKAAIKAADKDGNLRYLYQIFYSYFSFCPLGNPINETIKDGDISPWPLDQNCPYGHMERFDQIEWREHNNWLDHSYGEDRQVCASSAFTPSARRLYVWIRLHGIILCTISYLKGLYIMSQTSGTRLYHSVPGYARLYLTLLDCTGLYLAVLDCTWLYLAVLGCFWLHLAVLDCTRLYLVSLGFS